MFIALRMRVASIVLAFTASTTGVGSVIAEPAAATGAAVVAWESDDGWRPDRNRYRGWRSRDPGRAYGYDRGGETWYRPRSRPYDYGAGRYGDGYRAQRWRRYRYDTGGAPYPWGDRGYAPPYYSYRYDGYRYGAPSAGGWYGRGGYPSGWDAPRWGWRQL